LPVTDNGLQISKACKSSKWYKAEGGRQKIDQTPFEGQAAVQEILPDNGKGE